ncbi:MAG: aspartate dehydrogenase [Geminicoccaceae bacterium]|nr:aspartate dehydrogenase [Geminicoccaceae bacterium]
MSELGVAIGGFGAIGREVAKALVAGLPGLRLAAVSGRDRAKAEAGLAELGTGVPVLPLEALAEAAEIVLECLPAAVFREVAEPAISQGRIFMPLSVGQLLAHGDLIERAKATGARILPPTGALLGLDAVRAAAEGRIESVAMVTRKPPGGLAGAPHLVENGISVEGLTEPLMVFEGTAREGARGFPANVNVAAALSLAGIGPDRTTLQVWADPGVTRNVHRIIVEADSARFEMLIENVPSANPKTGKITALSTIAALRGLTATLKVGS